MKLIKYFSVCLLIFAINSCTSLSREETNSWLNKKGGPSTINMTGSWDSGGAATGGWGVGQFIQEGQRFYGTLGVYSADGIVNGDDIYMILSGTFKPFYSAHLKINTDGSFTGKVVEKIFIDKPEASNSPAFLIRLKKIPEDQASPGKNK